MPVRFSPDKYGINNAGFLKAHKREKLYRNCCGIAMIINVYIYTCTFLDPLDIVYVYFLIAV